MKIVLTKIIFASLIFLVPGIIGCENNRKTETDNYEPMPSNAEGNETLSTTTVADTLSTPPDNSNPATNENLSDSTGRTR